MGMTVPSEERISYSDSSESDTRRRQGKLLFSLCLR